MHDSYGTGSDISLLSDLEANLNKQESISVLAVVVSGATHHHACLHGIADKLLATASTSRRLLATSKYLFQPHLPCTTHTHTYTYLYVYMFADDCAVCVMNLMLPRPITACCCMALSQAALCAMHMIRQSIDEQGAAPQGPCNSRFWTRVFRSPEPRSKYVSSSMLVQLITAHLCGAYELMTRVVHERVYICFYHV